MAKITPAPVCGAKHPEFDIECQLPPEHVKPSTMECSCGYHDVEGVLTPGKPHEFSVRWLAEDIESGHFSTGEEWVVG